jgi:hypothetical protein
MSGGKRRTIDSGRRDTMGRPIYVSGQQGSSPRARPEGTINLGPPPYISDPLARIPKPRRNGAGRTTEVRATCLRDDETPRLEMLLGEVLDRLGSIETDLNRIEREQRELGFAIRRRAREDRRRSLDHLQQANEATRQAKALFDQLRKCSESEQSTRTEIGTRTRALGEFLKDLANNILASLLAPPVLTALLLLSDELILLGHRILG